MIAIPSTITIFRNSLEIGSLLPIFVISKPFLSTQLNQRKKWAIVHTIINLIADVNKFFTKGPSQFFSG